MSTNELVEPSEVVALFIKELQANTVQAQQLREALKATANYNDATVWGEVAQNAAVKAAFKRLQENLPESDYANRAWRRYHLNTDSVGLTYSNQVLANSFDMSIDRLASSHTLQWNDLGEASTGTQDISFLDVTARKITIPSPGLYRFMISMCLAYYPVGYNTTDFSTFRTDNITHARTGVNFATTLEVYTGNPSVRKYCLPLVSGKLSRADLSERRRRFFGGSQEILLEAGSVIQIVTQRAGRFATFSRSVGSIFQSANESIGFSKFIAFDNPNQQRDTQNWLEIVRLT